MLVYILVHPVSTLGRGRAVVVRSKGPIPALIHWRAFEVRVEGSILVLGRGTAAEFRDKGRVPELRRGRD